MTRTPYAGLTPQQVADCRRDGFIIVRKREAHHREHEGWLKDR